jgi:hypothetical protein
MRSCVLDLKNQNISAGGSSYGDRSHAEKRRTILE